MDEAVLVGSSAWPLITFNATYAPGGGAPNPNVASGTIMARAGPGFNAHPEFYICTQH